jgi:hypothetical protein
MLILSLQHVNYLGISIALAAITSATNHHWTAVNNFEQSVVEEVAILSEPASPCHKRLRTRFFSLLRRLRALKERAVRYPPT